MSSHRAQRASSVCRRLQATDCAAWLKSASECRLSRRSKVGILLERFVKRRRLHSIRAAGELHECARRHAVVVEKQRQTGESLEADRTDFDGSLLHHVHHRDASARRKVDVGDRRVCFVQHCVRWGARRARAHRTHDRIPRAEARRECDCGRARRRPSPSHSDCELPSRVSSSGARQVIHFPSRAPSRADETEQWTRNEWVTNATLKRGARMASQRAQGQ